VTPERALNDDELVSKERARRILQDGLAVRIGRAWLPPGAGVL
jgi:hypothetical protein